MSPADYLSLLIFVPLSGPKCAKALAFTEPGSRVVRVTLGLGENPPSTESITSRVLALCSLR